MMNYIDLHCDTLMMTWRETEGEDIVENSTYAVDFKRLKEAGAYAQFFAIFMLDPAIFKKIERPQICDLDYIDSLLGQLKRALRKTDAVRLATSYQDLRRNISNGVVSAFLTLEDGRVINDDLEMVNYLYKKGIRLITLTWNHENSIGYPNSTQARFMNRGLKPFGAEVVKEMNRRGMIIDVSHLSDGGFYDVLRLSQYPVMASHSNVRALSPHPRNLTDNMIKLLAYNDGVMGLNFCPYFLSPKLNNFYSKIDLMVEHLNYVKKLVGVNTLALGTDFEGFTGLLEINSTDKIELLFQRLDQEGWTTDEIEKFAYLNAMRVIKAVL